MATTVRYTAAQTILEYLRSGKSLSRVQAEEMFGISPSTFRRAIRSVTEKVTRYGNWVIKTHTRRNGETAYSMYRVVRRKKSDGSNSTTLDNPKYYSVGGRMNT